MLSEKRIKEFQKIHFEQFNKQISREEAIRQGESLISLAEIALEDYFKSKR